MLPVALSLLPVALSLHPVALSLLPVALSLLLFVLFSDLLPNKTQVWVERGVDELRIAPEKPVKILLEVTVTLPIEIEHDVAAYSQLHLLAISPNSDTHHDGIDVISVAEHILECFPVSIQC